MEENKELVDNQQVPTEQPLETYEQEPAKQEDHQEQQQEKPQDEREYNFAQLRKERERVERERDEYKQKLVEWEQYYQQQNPMGYQAQRVRSNPYTYEDAQYKEKLQEEYERLKEDDLVEGRHFKQIQQELKYLREKQAQQEQLYTVQRSMSNIRARYPDFDQIVSDKNVEILKHKYPSVARSLAAGKDIESIAESTYEIIKRFGIDQEDKYREQKAQVKYNSSKPLPMQATSPLAHANQYDNKRYTQEELDTAYKEMIAAKREA